MFLFAEREGFEPSVRLPVQRFSRPSRSATPASFLIFACKGNVFRVRRICFYKILSNITFITHSPFLLPDAGCHHMPQHCPNGKLCFHLPMRPHFTNFVNTNITSMSKLLTTAHDPMGAAITDYYKTGKAAKLRVFSPDFDEDEIPVSTLFRTFDEMPAVEQDALRMATGKILDVGAGSGCHALALADMGKDVEAIDISELSVEVMKARGVNARTTDLFSPSFQGKYDTILMLMNGAGIIGSLKNMETFFARMKQLLNEDGAIFMDSSDIHYVFEDEDGSMLIDLNGDYYGELVYSMKYRNITGPEFKWLYVDFDTLAYYASQNGFKAELITQGEHYDYLAKLTATK